MAGELWGEGARVEVQRRAEKPIRAGPGGWGCGAGGTGGETLESRNVRNILVSGQKKKMT